MPKLGLVTHTVRANQGPRVGRRRGLTIEIANKAVADCGDSGELGTGIDGGLHAPTLPFLASSKRFRTCSRW